MSGARLPGKSRLTSNTQFRAVIDLRTRFSDGLLAVYVADNGLEYSRLGISVGRSAGAAVWRNRVKRLIREVWRKSQASIPQGCDYVVMMTNKSHRRLPTYEEVNESFAALMDRFRARQEEQ